MKSLLQKRRKKILIFDPSSDQKSRWEGLFHHFFEQSANSEPILYFFSGMEEVWSNFLTEHPDIILLCSSIPTSDSFELCQKIRRYEGERHTGIIFVADENADHESMSVACLEMGADDFLHANCTSRELVARVKSVLRLKAITDELRSANHRLHLLSMTDELTGLANMRCFNLKLVETMTQCRQGKTGVGIIMLDIDHFKNVNDSANHLVGSFVIGEVGKLIRTLDVLEAGDVGARYGGDEFVIMCCVRDYETLAKKAEKLRQEIAKKKFQRDGVTIKITVSVGSAWVAPNFEGAGPEVIKAADLMLYRSKELGRNQVNGINLSEAKSRNAIDLDHVGRSHLIDWYSRRNDDEFP